MLHGETMSRGIETLTLKNGESKENVTLESMHVDVEKKGSSSSL